MNSGSAGRPNAIVTLDHGSGGRKARELIRSVFLQRFGGLESDSAIVASEGSRIAITTDGHVVKPLFFPGGDIGRLAVFGTVNDLAVSGADARYISASFILEEGFPMEVLEKIADSMADAAREAAVAIIAGDTKVIERGGCDGIFISTTGIGFVPDGRTEITRATRVRTGDTLIVNGPVGDHGAAVIAARNEIVTDPPLFSDCAVLTGVINRLYEAGIVPHFIRDATRGGIATVLCELAELCNSELRLVETDIPVRDQVRGLCDMYGFDPVYMANEGTAIFVIARNDANRAVSAMQADPQGARAAIVGRVGEAGRPRVVMKTSVGGSRIVRMLSGEQLPRIC